MNRWHINGEAERLERQVNMRANHDSRGLGVGSVAERSVFRYHAEKLLGRDWDWMICEGIGVTPQVKIIRYNGDLELGDKPFPNLWEDQA